MAFDPPPKIIRDFARVWRDWLYFLWDFVRDHTGGAIPTPPATGTDWNAHGNRAVGSAANELLIEPGTFHAKGNVGSHPSTLDTAENHFCWLPSKGSLRIGKADAGTLWTDANVPVKSFAIGAATNAGAINSVAIGAASDISSGGQNSLAIGSGNIITSSSANAIGVSCTGSAQSSTAIGSQARCISPFPFNIAIGNFVQANGFSTVCIGIGASDTAPMINTTWASMWLGVGSADPTLILRSQRCGILEKDPKSTIDVGGSVGYKQRNVSTSVDAAVTLSDELVLIVDPDTGDFPVTLPAISGVPRRMYHIKNAALAGGNDVTLVGTGSDFVDDGQGGALQQSPNFVSFPPGASIQVVANSTDSTWWVI